MNVYRLVELLMLAFAGWIGGLIAGGITEFPTVYVVGIVVGAVLLSFIDQR